MKIRCFSTRILATILCVLTVACSDVELQKKTLGLETIESPCNQIWFEKVDRQIASGDGQGHGPDLGSMEWRSVVEFKLGVRGDESLPAADSERWCAYIDQHFIN
ncbi:hypothetical protein [Shewanella kaireitica]|uniref:hypothetical protein n=1 Tax=Shewanella kaireitica TaxID=212021 RepID=UPI00200F74D3|nr:hypothetical protein [Shewanella kaireitica]MCL1093521.1 hypothetical protein [Shewanella kaireitica]